MFFRRVAWITGLWLTVVALFARPLGAEPHRLNSNTILFITGAFVSHHCWDDWRVYFEAQGYKTAAPPWPHKDAEAWELRARHPDRDIAAIRLADLVDYYAKVAGEMPEKPILIGHSLGGLVTQLLLQRDAAAAGVAIDSAAPQGVVSFEFSALRSTWKPLGYFTSVSTSHLLTFPQWQYAFTNGLALDVQKSSYERLVIPESKRVLRDSLTAAARVDFRRAHVPLLFIAGEKDHIIPASLNRKNFKRYKNEDSIVGFKEFPGRTHFVLGQDGWKEVADYILAWL